MKTYQDFEKSQNKLGFLIQAITEYKMSETYQWAKWGDDYNRQQNTTITNYVKYIRNLMGQEIVDYTSANHKCASNFFHRFVTQEIQYLLGNGAYFDNDDVKSKLGTRQKPFDNQLQELATKSLIGGVSFGFFNADHLEVFSALEFVPLWDEETGGLRAGIRFWRLDINKPQRFTLYEIDGFTDFVEEKGSVKILNEKRPYKTRILTTKADGEEIIAGENYNGFPIVPLWGNKEHQSELVGIKSEIDCYDLIKSGFANDIDEASFIYWTIENAGGMEDLDLIKFVEHMKTIHAVNTDEGRIQAHQLDVPHQARESFLNRLENDLYTDSMSMNPRKLDGGSITATEIKMAYQALDEKCDGFEYNVIDFVQRVLLLIGDETSEITFKRNRVANQAEETAMILSAAQFLDDETIIKHLPFISVDEVESILENRMNEESNRFEDEPSAE